MEFYTAEVSIMLHGSVKSFDLKLQFSTEKLRWLDIFFWTKTKKKDLRKREQKFEIKGKVST